MRVRLNNADAKAVMQEISRCASVTEFKSLSRDERNRYIKDLKEQGLSIRQISRLTRISFATVLKAI
jgi:transposase-like protein